MNKKIFFIGGMSVVIILGAVMVWYMASYKTQKQVSSFEDCAAAGNAVMESYPRQCTTKDGRHFVEKVATLPEAPTKEIEITVASPKPGAEVASPFMVSGSARGSWYFEAVFPVKLVDSNGVTVATGQAQAQGDWMNAGLVPFTAELTWTTTPATPDGTLIFRKDNPSGLPQNDAEMRVAVKFKK